MNIQISGLSRIIISYNYLILSIKFETNQGMGKNDNKDIGYSIFDLPVEN